MDKQLKDVKVETYLLEGDKDLLFHFKNRLIMQTNTFHFERSKYLIMLGMDRNL
jgi:hypothetical protein